MVAHPMGSVHKAELTWDQVATGDFPLTPAQLFAQAVLSEATKAAMPHANGRIERARDLVLAGLVGPQPNSTYAVRSESATGKTYSVTPEGCPCPDAVKAEGGRCKHLLATWIWRKARAQVEARSLPALEAGATPPAAANGTAAPPAPEADDSPAPGPDTPALVPPAGTGQDERPQAPGLPALATAPLPEAPASVNVHVELAGRKVQLG